MIRFLISFLIIGSVLAEDRITPAHLGSICIFQTQEDGSVIKTYPGFIHLVQAIKKREEQKVLKLIAQLPQENLNIQDSYGLTPLMIAIETDQHKIALVLVEAMNKEGLLLEDKEEMNALMYARFYKMPKVADAILVKIGL